ncbi:MAG: hypothetical protein J6S05_00695 [Bacteroidaceae bacterium]|nr:hypothetical protein [Bacteroidaceae bacterium]
MVQKEGNVTFAGGDRNVFGVSNRVIQYDSRIAYSNLSLEIHQKQPIEQVYVKHQK